MPAQNVKAIVKRYFTEFPEDNSKWKCRCGNILTQKPNTGWSNLFQHIKSQHSDYLQDAQSTLQSFVVSKPASMKKAANIYSCLEWIWIIYQLQENMRTIWLFWSQWWNWNWWHWHYSVTISPLLTSIACLKRLFQSFLAQKCILIQWHRSSIRPSSKVLFASCRIVNSLIWRRVRKVRSPIS